MQFALCRSFCKEQNSESLFFSLLEKSEEERFTTFVNILYFCPLFKKSKRAIVSVALLKRATKSNLLFHSLPEEQQRAICSFALLKRAIKSDSLFCSLPKEQQGAIDSFALYQKTNKSDSLFCSLFCSFGKE